MARRARQERMELQASCVAHLDWQVPKAMLANVEIRALQALLVGQAFVVPMVLLVVSALLVSVAPRASRALKVPKDLLVI